MPRSRTSLPAVLAVPLLADRLAMELGQAAVLADGPDPAERERAAFLTSAAAQVADYGTGATAEPAPEPAVQLRPAASGGHEDLETRTG